MQWAYVEAKVEAGEGPQLELGAETALRLTEADVTQRKVLFETR